MNSLAKLITFKYSKLENLYLTDCKLKTQLTDFINFLGACTTLKLLDISGNDVGDFGVNLLAKSLQVNRSLQTLLFDRSNVSTIALHNIVDALKRYFFEIYLKKIKYSVFYLKKIRNFTLRTIQMPVNDLCILYQKSPEKIVEISKQVAQNK